MGYIFFTFSFLFFSVSFSKNIFQYKIFFPYKHIFFCKKCISFKKSNIFSKKIISLNLVLYEQQHPIVLLSVSMILRFNR